MLAAWLLALTVLGGLLYWSGSTGSEKAAVGKEAPSAVEVPRSNAVPPVAAPPESRGTPPASTRPSAKETAPDQRDPSPPAAAPAPPPLNHRPEDRVPAAPGRPLIEPPPKIVSRDIPSDADNAGPQPPQEKTLLALNKPSNSVATKPDKPPTPPARVPPVGRVAIIIDDFGQSVEMARKFLEIPLSITFSVLPNEPHSREIAQMAHAARREVLLHLPMEPHGYPKINPGTGALLVSMSRDEIRKTLHSALDVSPYFSGVNNHMGSRFTQESSSMTILLAELHERKLFFVDSRTTHRSTGYTLAQKLKVPAAQRDIFLDHTQTEEFVRSQLNQLIRRAKIHGSAIAIGHPYECTLKVLSRSADRFHREGIEVVPSGELVGLPGR